MNKADLVRVAVLQTGRDTSYIQGVDILADKLFGEDKFRFSTRDLYELEYRIDHPKEFETKSTI